MKLIVSVVAVLAALLLIYSFGIFDPPILTACEAKLKKYLVAPSTYERNRFFLSNRPATRTDVEERYENNPYLKDVYLKEFDKGRMKPVYYSATLNFSVLNKNAEVTTTTVVCQYLSRDGSTSKLAMFEVLPRTTDTSTFSQILRDTSNDPPLTEQEKLDYTKPIAPYVGWVRDTLRRFLD
ncbi:MULTISPECIES: hypothetical protein [unclassified Rhizobium]|uniref:hypothetical protein n=1 Tax=unclassified Rhizobium TaxID=2613769 RepID=UPI000ABCA565|nr:MULTISPECIES: hypothetical protein [unclassified Rhizobium]MBN8951451.1 hypothetical protein [Rhizobium tropici]RKD66755.1 hypothetical protein BJ928_106283 [Rhizobium sp. WW_1]